MPLIVGALRTLLLHLFHTRGWDPSDRVGGAAQAIYEIVVRDYRPVGDSREFEAVLLPNKERLSLHAESVRPYIYLKPGKLGGGVLPIMAMSYDLAGIEDEDQAGGAIGEPGQACFVLAMFFRHMDTPRESGIKSLGFRFETAHGEGEHGFCHSQFVRRFSKQGDTTLRGCPAWIPTKEPTIPIDARGPVSLLGAILVSLYGPRVLEGMGTGERNLLKQYLAGMHCDPI